MTRNEAIKQLDWYFDYDNGIAAEDKTKEAYALLRDIVFKYEEYDKKRRRLFSDTMVCPVCRDSMKWNMVLGHYKCPTCGVTSNENEIGG